MKTPVLKAVHLCKRFAYPNEVTILQDISLEVFPGESVAIVGKSGEGKTTLLHLLGTLEEPSSGTLEICGKPANLKESPTLRSAYLGFIFQAYHLLEDCTGLENILIAAQIAKKEIHPGSTTHTNALTLLEEVGLSHRASFPVRLLSGGEKQRIALARAFINDPAIILADEPSGNLDNTHSQVIYTLLLDSAHKRGKAVVIVTHDLELASRCKKTYALQGGRLS